MSITTSPSSSFWQYTVLGNFDFLPGREDFSFSGVVLPRGPSYFQIQAARQLVELGAGEVFLFLDPGALWIETGTDNLPLRLIRSEKKHTAPELLNLAMNEARGEWVLVITDDMEVLEPFPPASLVKGTRSPSSLVLLPELRTRENDEVPSLVVPLRRGRILQFHHLFPRDEQTESLIPLDLAGLYQPGTFLQTGGFDPGFPDAFWQKMDWGFRVHLWGESLRHIKGFRVRYSTTPPSEDMSPRGGYGRFYLKNIAPRFYQDHSRLQTRSFWPFLVHGGHSTGMAWKEFRLIQNWIREHQFRFRTDAAGLKALWGDWK